MTLIGVLGDCTTTTCVALAAIWPTSTRFAAAADVAADVDVVVLEADPAGGSLAGWLDTPSSPSLATIVANTATGPDDPSTLVTIMAMTHRSAAGVRFVAAPVRSRSARRAIAEALATVAPALAAAPDLVALADFGRMQVGSESARWVEMCDVVVLVHRQASASAAAESVRLERLAEQVEQLVGQTVVLAIIGDAPFDPAEIADHVDRLLPDVLADWVVLAEDPLAAAVLAGRTGVSAKRLQRLPLMRSARAGADRLSSSIRITTGRAR